MISAVVGGQHLVELTTANIFWFISLVGYILGIPVNIYSRASEAKVSSHVEECAKVKLLLDEERKKVEDLQFRLEEEQIVG